MNINGINPNKVSRILAVLFVLYVSISLLVIVFPEIQFGKRLTQVYKRYVSPGPFFTASRITQTTLLYLSWKVNGQWTEPINPTLTSYKNFFANWNPSLMYRSRLEGYIYETIISENKKQADSVKVSGFHWPTNYFQHHYVPSDADSVSIILARNITEQFKSKSDTIQIIRF